MSYIPEVGHRVRGAAWAKGTWVEVTAVGRAQFLGILQPGGIGDEERWNYGNGFIWERIPDPVVYPERWMNVFTNGAGAGWSSRHDADYAAAGQEHRHRIGIIHLHPDGTLTMEQS